MATTGITNLASLGPITIIPAFWRACGRKAGWLVVGRAVKGKELHKEKERIGGGGREVEVVVVPRVVGLGQTTWVCLGLVHWSTTGVPG